MAKVLFVSPSNTARSQMSAALLERAAEGRHTSLSVGTAPGSRVHPEVVEVMREVGIDLSGCAPRELTDQAAKWADVVVTMGCGDALPPIRRARYIEWELPDPQGKPVEEVRAVRDEIDRRVQELLPNLG